VDLPGHDDESVHAMRLWSGGDADGVGDVAGTVGVSRGRVPLGSGEHQGACRGEDEVDQVGRFLHGVGAVGDHNAVHLGVL
jgi:hypothetical protein